MSTTNPNKVPVPEEAGSLRFEPYDTESGMERYLDCYRDAWTVAHGSLQGFNARACRESALIRAADSPDALTAAFLGDTFAGILGLDERRGAARRIGWIAFCYVVPELRGRGLGARLIDAAAEYYRGRRREVLRLTVAPANPAVGFYETLGFRCVDHAEGALEPLMVMEKRI